MRRSLAVLRVLARHHEEGISSSDVIAESGLERSTAHRLLTCLVEEGFAERDALTRRYRLGIDAMRLGLASLRRAPLVAMYQPLMQRIARQSEDTVYLIMRQGDFSVCLHREDGAFPVRIFNTRIGDVRPLGIGVGGMALLAAAPDDDYRRIRAQNAPVFDAAGLNGAQCARVIARTRRTGFSEMIDTITSGVGGVGVALPNPDGVPFAAVTIAAITPRMGPARRTELGNLLMSSIGAETAVLNPP